VVIVWAGIVHDILIGPYLLPWRLSAQIYWVFLEEKLPKTCGSSMTGMRRTLHIRSDNTLPPLTMISWLYKVGLWLGLPNHWTSHQWTSSYGATLKPWFTHHQLILKRNLIDYHWGSSNLVFLSAHVSLLCWHQLCIEVGGCSLVYICSKLVWNTIFLENSSMLLLDFHP
jgi:hypothetical protein